MKASLLLVFVVLSTVVATSGAAERLAYTAQPAFGGLKFNQPLALVSPPGDTSRIFVLEKPGRILVINSAAPQNPVHVFLDLRDKVGNSDSEKGVLALAFHPDWKRNRQFFVYYTSDIRGRREDRLSRFLISENASDSADASSETPLIAQADDAGNHNGGELLFGPDGYLYLSLGDEGGANDDYGNSQRIDHDFFSGIIRIDVDQRPGNLAPNPHAAVRPGTYSIPADNPFIGVEMFDGKAVAAARLRTEFWAVGLRNPWRMSFDSVTGRLWCGDVGQSAQEEVNVIVRGGNYGWNYREGRAAFRGRAPAGVVFNEPVWTYPRSQGVSITGGLVYRGERSPDLVGKYLFGDYTGRIWALDPDDDKPVNRDRVQQIALVPLVVSFGRDPSNGDVLMVSLGGSVLRLVRDEDAKKK